MRTGFGVIPGRRVALCLPISFGAGLNVLIGSLINGADIAAIDPRDRAPGTVLDALAESRAEIAFLAPSLLRALSGAQDAASHPAWRSLRRIITTGEALTADVAQAVLAHAPDATVTNWVGSSETSALAYFDLRAGDIVAAGALPAGSPAPHKTITIDDDGRVVVSSRYLALGYLDPSADRGRFTRDAAGLSSFRTGDRGRWDGTALTLTGRVDDAVKIRGYLVEPAEVHRAIMSDGDLSEAAVIARTDSGSGRTELIAYVAPIPGGRTPPAAEIRNRLRERLPEWMIPAHLIELSSLPRTARGKVDRSALPAPSRRIDPPTGDLERSVASIWTHALGLDEVGRDENIYAIGADSLTVAQILVGVTRRFGVALTQADAAAAPTVAEMARTLDSRLRPDNSAVWREALAPTTVPLRHGLGQTVFCFAGAGASALVFVALADHLARDPRIGAIYGFAAARPGESRLPRLDGRYRGAKASPRSPSHPTARTLCAARSLVGRTHRPRGRTKIAPCRRAGRSGDDARHVRAAHDRSRHRVVSSVGGVCAGHRGDTVTFTAVAQPDSVVTSRLPHRATRRLSTCDGAGRLASR